MAFMYPKHLHRRVLALTLSHIGKVHTLVSIAMRLLPWNLVDTCRKYPSQPCPGTGVDTFDEVTPF